MCHEGEANNAVADSNTLLPQLAQADLLVVVLVEHLGRSKIKVFLSHVHSSLSERELWRHIRQYRRRGAKSLSDEIVSTYHASLCADAFQLCAGAAIHLFRNLF